MLAHMDDPAAIGPAMAVCLITVFYGLLLGQFIYLPLASYVEGKAAASQSEGKSKGEIVAK